VTLLLPGGWSPEGPIEYTAPCPVCGDDCLFTSTMKRSDRTMANSNGQMQSRIYTEVETTESCACALGAE
jgi:hypothetical protein